jgi:hypothetical protein
MRCLFTRCPQALASANVMVHVLLRLSRGLSGEADRAPFHNGQGEKLLKAVVRSHRGGGKESVRAGTGTGKCSAPRAESGGVYMRKSVRKVETRPW